MALDHNVLDFSVTTVAHPELLVEQAGLVTTADPRLSDSRNPLPHTHAISDINGLSAALAAAGGTQVSAQQKTGDATVSDNTLVPFRAGRNSETVMTQLHGKYYEQALRGHLFFSIQNNQTVKDFAPNQSSSHGLYNPSGSGIICSVVSFQMTIFVRPVTPVDGVYALYGNVTAPLTVPSVVSVPTIPCYINSGDTSTCKTASTAGGINGSFFSRVRTIAHKEASAAINSISPFVEAYSMDFDGTLILAPGTFLWFCQSSVDATNATADTVFIWEEIAVQ